MEIIVTSSPGFADILRMVSGIYYAHNFKTLATKNNDTVHTVSTGGTPLLTTQPTRLPPQQKGPSIQHGTQVPGQEQASHSVNTVPGTVPRRAYE